MVQQKYSRIVSLFKGKDTDLVFEDGSVAKDQLKKAMAYIESDWTRCKNDVMKMIVDMELGDSKADDIKKEEHKQFVSFMMEYMNNMSLKLKDKSTQCRFSPEIVNISMSLYMRNKAAYSELRSCNIVPLPHQDKLKKHLSVFKPTEGIDPISMLFMKDICKKSDIIVEGHVMMDEIKLKMASCGIT